MTATDLSSIPQGSPWVPFGLQTAAYLLGLFHDVLAVVAFILCLILFRRHRQIGWLFLSAVFLEPLYLLVTHALHGRPLVYYKLQTLQDGALVVTYRWDFPVFYILSVIGLFMLARRKTKRNPVGDEPRVSD